MDCWVRFNAQSQAKERLIRAAQYSCTLLGYTLLKSQSSADLRRTVSQLEAHMSLTRKLLRLGNSVEALQAAKRTIHQSDGVLRLCLTLGHLNRALYFLCDNLLWAGKTGVLKDLDQSKWSHRAFRYYLFSLLLNLTRDLYEVRLLMERETRAGASKPRTPSSDPAPTRGLPAVCVWLQQQLLLVATVCYSNPPLLLDLLKNSCDLFIPLDRLGLCPTGAGVVGACGLASSLLSILTLLHPWLKIKP